MKSCLAPVYLGLSISAIAGFGLSDWQWWTIIVPYCILISVDKYVNSESS